MSTDSFHFKMKETNVYPIVPGRPQVKSGFESHQLSRKEEQQLLQVDLLGGSFERKMFVSPSYSHSNWPSGTLALMAVNTGKITGMALEAPSWVPDGLLGKVSSDGMG